MEKYLFSGEMFHASLPLEVPRKFFPILHHNQCVSFRVNRQDGGRGLGGREGWNVAMVTKDSSDEYSWRLLLNSERL